MSQPKIADTEISSPLMRYRELVASGELMPDGAQEALVGKLDHLFCQLLGIAKVTGLRKWFARKSTPAGLYIWGDVGRGKSMAMDLFVAAIKDSMPTRRVHFHAFMLDVHKRLHAFRQLDGKGDVMPRLIEELVSEHKLLCLDEFQVHDVTDAAILARLFGGLLEAGVCVIFTSNRAPRDLYQGGLQRDQFLRFVDEVVVARMEIYRLESAEDYRLKQLTALTTTYKYPRNLEADEFLLDTWNKLTHGEECEPLQLEVQGRVLRVDKHAKGIAWLTFNELCARPLGANDYLELARVLHTLIIQGIPKLTPEQRNEAKRFVTLIDAMYDHRIKCIFTAETQPEGIYDHGDGTFEFARTVSRLIEMQSANYLALTKR